MFGGLAKSIFGSSNDRYVRSLNPILAKIASFEPTLQAMSDAELSAQTQRFRDRLADGAKLAAGSKDGKVRIYGTADGKQLFEMAAHTGAVTGLAPGWRASGREAWPTTGAVGQRNVVCGARPRAAR